MGRRFMKKMLLSLILLVPMLTGCANINTEVTINDNKSAEVVTTLDYAGDLRNPQDEVAQTIMKNYPKFIAPDFNTDSKLADDESIIKIIKKVNDISNEDLDLTALGFKTNLKSGKFLEVRKNFLITSYNVDLTYDYKEQAKKIEKVEDEKLTVADLNSFQPTYYQKYGDPNELEPQKSQDDFIASNMDDDAKALSTSDDTQKEEQNNEPDNNVNATFTIKLPTEASFNNATSVDGTSYTWEISKDSPTSIKLQYVKYKGFAISFVIIVAIGLLVLLTKKLIKHESQKRMDNIKNIV
jgi:hypothetical protein